MSTLVIGGRYLAPSPETPAPALAVRVGETDLPPVTLSPGAFVLTWTLPAGTIGPTGYAPLTVRAVTAPAGAATERIFLEQFDVQPQGVPVVALEAGWYEPERDVVSGRQWRWVANESRVRIAGASGDVRLVIAGTYPRHYDRAPVLEIFAGGQRIASHTLTRPFLLEQRITAQQLGAEGVSRGELRRRSSLANVPALPTHGDWPSILRRCVPTLFVDTTTIDRYALARCNP